MTPLRLDAAIVYPDRIELSVLVAHPCFAFSSRSLIDTLVQTHPYLLEHTCKNERGATFAAVAATTSTPHVLEHMIIDNQIHALAQTSSLTSTDSTRSNNHDTILVGTTQWDEGCEPDRCELDSEPNGCEVVERIRTASSEDQKVLKATVRVSFFDDVAAFAAINAALAELNELLVTAC